MTEKTTFIPNLPKQILEESTLHLNLSEGFIFITEDKVRICLMKYVEYLEKRGSWIAPAGILITIITVVVTADFKNKLFPKEVWSALFIVAGIVSLVWLIFAISKTKKIKTIDDVINDLKLKAEPSTKVGSIPQSTEEKVVESSEVQKFVLNYVYEKKGVQFQEILKDLALDYYNLKNSIRLLINRRLIQSYTDDKGREIYCLPETEAEAKEKYPEQEIPEGEFRVENIPF